VLFSNKEGSAARNYFYSALLWIVFGMGAGLTAALLMVFPDMLKDALPLGITKYFTFGRMRPTHTNTVMFGWLTGAYFATLFYMIPRLVGTKLWSERLGNASVWLFNITIGANFIALLAGANMGREYAEMPMVLKYMFVLTFAMVAINVFMTIKNRTEKELYVSVWYMVAGVLLTPIIYIVGNQFLFPTNPISGVNDAVVNWFYGHNILGYWFTPVGVGAVYYLLPKLTGNPIYSHRLSMIGFWTILFVYGPVGAHHLINGPVPYWLQTISIAFSVTLIIPVWAVLTNFYGTMNGKWYLVKESVPLKFLVSGAVFYFITCFQGPMQALRSVSAITHFTNWVVGHAHLALLGMFSFVMFACIYYIIPRVTNKAIYSKAAQEWHFWLSLVGFVAFFVSLTVAGLIQGSMWAQSGSADFMNSVMAIKPYYIVRAIGGAMLLVGQLVFIWNIWKTVKVGKPFSAAAEAPAVTSAAQA
jgi:cytochrome c oxidase cbb3-type subunit 1